MRYTGRVNLKLDGGIPAAQRLIPLARKILGQLYNRNHELGILGPEGQSVHNHTAEDGSEIRVWWNPWEPMIRIVGVGGAAAADQVGGLPPELDGLYVLFIGVNLGGCHPLETTLTSYSRPVHRLYQVQGGGLVRKAVFSAQTYPLPLVLSGSVEATYYSGHLLDFYVVKDVVFLHYMTMQGFRNPETDVSYAQLDTEVVGVGSDFYLRSSVMSQLSDPLTTTPHSVVSTLAMTPLAPIFSVAVSQDKVYLLQSKHGSSLHTQSAEPFIVSEYGFGGVQTGGFSTELAPSDLQHSDFTHVEVVNPTFVRRHPAWIECSPDGEFVVVSRRDPPVESDLFPPVSVQRTCFREGASVWSDGSAAGVIFHASELGVTTPYPESPAAWWRQPFSLDVKGFDAGDVVATLNVSAPDESGFPCPNPPSGFDSLPNIRPFMNPFRAYPGDQPIIVKGTQRTALPSDGRGAGLTEATLSMFGIRSSVDARIGDVLDGQPCFVQDHFSAVGIRKDLWDASQWGGLSAALLDQHNAARQQNGLGSLSVDLALQGAASSHAKWMAENESLSHTGAGGTGVADRVFYNCFHLVVTQTSTFQLLTRYVAENIALSSESNVVSGDLMEAWLASPGHMANISEPEFDLVGFGFAQNNGLYVCVVFGSEVGTSDGRPESRWCGRGYLRSVS